MQVKDLDLIVFGANAFTGRLAAEYLARKPGLGLKWAIAGRNGASLEKLHAKLGELPSPPAERIVVDHSDFAAVRAQVARTRVALTFAGPFARYGESVVAGCAELGTHYLDITGETLWVSRMIEKYEAAARKSGAILIPFSGFDSVPSDLGTWALLEKARGDSRPLTKIQGVFSGRGGVNGGTFETMMDVLRMRREELRKVQDPALLVPAKARERFAYSDCKWPERVPAEGLTAPVFFMAMVNSRVVYRSHALRALALGKPDPAFEYVELQKISTRFSGPVAWGVALAADTLTKLGRLPPVRRLYQSLGPKAGEGPSERSRENGFFRARFYAYSGDEVVGQAEISYPGDPGNKSTVLMACESALCLVAATQPPVSGGFWTPSTGLGSRLRDRLVSAGVQFTVQ
jgi:short subunit dehydrogenase-like uncharacterized protein